MKLIFEQSISGSTYLYIHCSSAGDQLRISEKLHTHSEYNTKWSDLLEEWREKGYYKYYSINQMSSRSDVITLLEFTNSRDDEFMRELNKYLEYETAGGYFGIEYKLFNNK